MISHYQSQSKRKRPDNDKSYQTLVHHYKSILILISQSNNPLLLFLAEKPEDLLRDLMSIFVKPEILNKVKAPCRLTKINVSDKDNRWLPELIVLLAATKTSLRKASLSLGIIISIKKGCMKVLTHFVEKIQERLPLKFSIVCCVPSTSLITWLENLILQLNCLRNWFIGFFMMHDK